jgi:hypothetical protein
MPAMQGFENNTSTYIVMVSAFDRTGIVLPWKVASPFDCVYIGSATSELLTLRAETRLICG